MVKEKEYEELEQLGEEERGKRPTKHYSTKAERRKKRLQQKRSRRRNR